MHASRHAHIYMYTQTTHTYITNSAHKQYVYANSTHNPIQICTFYPSTFMTCGYSNFIGKKRQSQEDTLVIGPFIIT